MTKERKQFRPLTSKEVFLIYELLKEDNLIPFSVCKDGENKIDALIYNVGASNYGVENYPTIEQKVVAYMYFIIKNHPFIDGNKRTSVLVFLVLISLNKLKLVFPKHELDSIAVFIEKTSDDHQIIIKALAEIMFEQTP